MKRILFILIFPFLSLAVYSQNVGIGTTTPHESAILDLSSTGKGLLLPRMTSSQRNGISSPQAGLMIYNSDLLEFQQHDGISWKSMLNQNYWRRSLSRGFVYNLDDSLGIGTSAPSYKLHIQNGSAFIRDNRVGFNPYVHFEVPAVNDKEGGLQWLRSGTKLAGLTYVADPDYANYVKIAVSNTGNGSDLVVNSDGFVGMGTLNPEARLHLRGVTGDEILVDAVDPIIQLNQANINSSTKKGFIQLSGDNLRIGTNSSNSLGQFVVRTDGVDRMFVDGDGNVSIGTQTAAPGYILRVGGKIISEEVKVKLRGN